METKHMLVEQMAIKTNDADEPTEQTPTEITARRQTAQWNEKWKIMWFASILERHQRLIAP